MFQQGEKGFFRIRRGTNEAQIEDLLFAGIPQIPITPKAEAESEEEEDESTSRAVELAHALEEAGRRVTELASEIASEISSE